MKKVLFLAGLYALLCVSFTTPSASQKAAVSSQPQAIKKVIYIQPFSQPFSQPFAISVSLLQTVEDTKEQLVPLVGASSAADVSLLYQGLTLDDNATLDDYGITGGVTVLVSLL